MAPPGIAPSPGGGASDIDAVMEDLVPALWQSFAVILVGYSCAKLEIVRATHKQGLSLYVTKLALPALLFTGMASLDFSSVNWLFLLAVAVGKTFVFCLAIGVTSLLDMGKPYVLGTGGVHAIFVSQSNDFALGLPIFLPIFGVTHPDYIGYLYLVAPISLLLLNPMAFMLMESARDTGDDEEEGEEEEDAGGGTVKALGGSRAFQDDLLDCCDDVPEGDEEAALVAAPATLPALAPDSASTALKPAATGATPEAGLAGVAGNAVGVPIKQASPPISMPGTASPGCRSVRGEAGSAPATYSCPAPTREASVSGGGRALYQPLLSAGAGSVGAGGGTGAGANAVGTEGSSRGYWFQLLDRLDALKKLREQDEEQEKQEQEREREREREQRLVGGDPRWQGEWSDADGERAEAEVEEEGQEEVEEYTGDGDPSERRHMRDAAALRSSRSVHGGRPPRGSAMQAALGAPSQESSLRGDASQSAARRYMVSRLGPLMQQQHQQQPPSAAVAFPRGNSVSEAAAAAASAAGGTLPFTSVSQPRQGNVTFAGVPPDKPLSGPSVSSKHRPPIRQTQQDGVVQEQTVADLVPPKGTEAADAGGETGGLPAAPREEQPSDLGAPKALGLGPLSPRGDSALPEGWSVRKYTGRPPSKRPVSLKKQLRKLGKVMLGVASSPVVFMVPVGLFANWLFDHVPPPMVKGPFDMIGVAFSPLSLFILGMAMADHTEASACAEGEGALALEACHEEQATQLGPLITSLALVAGKCLVAPLVTTLMLIALDVDTSLSVAGLIYGSLPVTPAVFFFATEYGLCQPYIGMATVLGTFLFGPLVYLLTQLAFLVLYNKRALTNQVENASHTIAIIGLIFASWTLAALLSQLIPAWFRPRSPTSAADPSSRYEAPILTPTLTPALTPTPTPTPTPGPEKGPLLPPLDGSAGPPTPAPGLGAPANSAGGARVRQGSLKLWVRDALHSVGMALLGNDEKQYSVHHQINTEFICIIAFCWVVASGATLLCSVELPPALSLLRYVGNQGAQMGACAFTALLAVSELLSGAFGPRVVYRIRLWFFLAGAVAAAVATALPLLITSGPLKPPVPPHNMSMCLYPYQGPQLLVNMVCYSLAVFMVIASLAILFAEQVAGQRRAGVLVRWQDIRLTWRNPVRPGSLDRPPYASGAPSMHRGGPRPGAGAFPSRMGSVRGPAGGSYAAGGAPYAVLGRKGSSSRLPPTSSLSTTPPISANLPPPSPPNPSVRFASASVSGAWAGLGRPAPVFDSRSVDSGGSGFDGAGRFTFASAGPRAVSTRWKQTTDVDAQNGILLYCCYSVLSYLAGITFCITCLSDGNMKGGVGELLMLLCSILAYSKGAVLFLAFGADIGLLLPLVALREWWISRPLPDFMRGDGIRYNDYTSGRWADTVQTLRSALPKSSFWSMEDVRGDDLDEPTEPWDMVFDDEDDDELEKSRV